MKRGPEPVKGYDAAIPAALRRGRVMRFRSSPSYPAMFLIYGNGLTILVCLRFARRLSRVTIGEIIADNAGAIAGLRTIPQGGPVCLELWLYSRYGALRFFRIGENGSPEEIDRDGLALVNGKPVSKAEPATGVAGPAAPVPAAGFPEDPCIVNPPGNILWFLKKRNAMNAQAVECGNATGLPDGELVTAAPPGVSGSSHPQGREGGGEGVR